ncbi:MAG: hypothetical protein ABI442_06210 [Gemmatimonadaceae bacterium]
MVRAEQMGFESFRRNRLPEQSSGGSVDHCDARIGRYCYWRGDDDDEQAPPEKPAIRDRRNTLLATLDTAAHTLTGDGWLAGQNVRYLVEADRIDDALRFARRDCRAESYWCFALAGFAAHAGGRFAIADSEFTHALAAMDAAERASWLDVELLLTDDLADRFKKVAPADREPFVRRMMWLGAPLLSISPTDLFTEHLARVTRARIAEHSATPDGTAWADDVRDVMVRYGWPRWYSRTRPDVGSMREPQITGHDEGMPYDFLPRARLLDSVTVAQREDWDLDDRHAATGYAPRYARSVHDVPHQIALFRRADSTLAVAAWDARRDTTLIGRSLDAALVLSSDADHSSMSRAPNSKATGRISTIGVIDSGIVSLELLATDDRRAARVRVGVPRPPTSAMQLSDLLLYVPTGDAPLTLDAVRDSTLTSETIPASRSAGVYWEVYGLMLGDGQVHYTLTVEQVGTGLLRHIAEALRFADPTTALRIQWDEVPQVTNGIAGRGVRVDFTQLRTGRYRLQLAVSAGDRTTQAFRVVEVR